MTPKPRRPSKARAGRAGSRLRAKVARGGADRRTNAAAGSAVLDPKYRGARIHVTVTREIGSQILRGDFPPGTVLPNEAEWSRRFKVSRSVVRESIKVLGGKGLLLARPRIGTTVEPRERWNLLDRDVLAWYSAIPAKGPFLVSVQEMRRIIEPEAAALAALKRSDAQMEAISSACVDMGTAPSMRARVDADVRFHLGILAAAGNEFLIPFGYLIASALAALFEYTTRGRADLAHAHQLHERIEEAIRRKQPQSARDAVRRLVNNTDDFLGHKSHERTRKRAR
jgi:DNA-binding FadR family transcriptional regulator